MNYASGPIRELTNDERMKWGDCPICHATHGEYCRADVGIQLGVKVDGSRMRDGEGCHTRRLMDAPFQVREVPA